VSAFRYEAVDAQGKLRRGLVEADTPRAVRDRLRSDGLFPTAIDGTTGQETSGSVEHVRVPRLVVTLATRQLATLVRSSMPLDQALGAVAEQADDRRMARVMTSLRAQVESGESLANAMARWPRTFGGLYRGLVRVAGETGRLGEVLARLADYLEAREALRQRFTLALIYPALVTIIALAVIVVLLTYVVPQVVSVYQQSRQTLPWLTRALIATSAFFRATGWLWATAAIIAVVAVSIANRFATFRAAWHRSLLRLAVVARLVVAIETARFASTLAILVASGAPLLRALDAATDVLWSIPIRHAAQSAALLVREGVSLARALRDQRIFPPVLVHLVANGEASGQLSAMLERAAEELEREAERRLTWIAALLQPALIVLMGAIVLVLVLAIMLPIVSMNQLIR